MKSEFGMPIPAGVSALFLLSAGSVYPAVAGEFSFDKECIAGAKP